MNTQSENREQMTMRGAAGRKRMSPESENKIRTMLRKRSTHKKMRKALKASVFLFSIMIRALGEEGFGEEPESFIVGVCMTLAIGGMGLFSFFGAVLTYISDHDEGLLRDLLEECQGEDFKVLAFDHDLEIPLPVILRTGLMDPYTYSFGQDYLVLCHRGYHVVCSRLMLLERVRTGSDRDRLQEVSETGGAGNQGSQIKDNKTEKSSQDDLLSWAKSIRSQEYSITGRSFEKMSENEESEGFEDAVRFDGTVLLFPQGPDLDGCVSIEVRDNEEYAYYLQQNAAALAELCGGRRSYSDIEQENARVSDLFYRYHYVHAEPEEVSQEQASEELSESVVTPRVMKMILCAESFAQAPVELHASGEMVCITVQRPLYRFPEILKSRKPAEQIGIFFKEEIGRFRHFLDILTGEPDSPVNELFCRETQKEKSVLAPFLLPVQENKIPSNREIGEYIEIVITSAWTYYEEIHSTFMRRNPRIYRQRMRGFLQEDIFMKADLSAVENVDSLLDAMTEIYMRELLTFCCTPCSYEIEEIHVIDQHPAEGEGTDQKDIAEEGKDGTKRPGIGEIEVCVAIHPPVMEWDLHWNAAPALRRMGGSAKRLRKLACAGELQPEFLELFELALKKQGRDGKHSGETCRRTLQLKKMENMVYGVPRDRLDLFVNQVFCSAFSLMKINGQPLLLQNKQWL